MAQLKDTIINGSLRVTDSLFANTISVNSLTLQSATASTAIVTDANKNLTSRAITDNITATAVTASTNLITANTLYYHKGNSNIVTVGTITSGTWSATEIAVNKGGTGKTSWTQWGVLYASASTTLTNTAAGAANTALMGKGSAAPAFVSVTPSISITAGTADNAPKVNLTVLGVTGTTAQELTKASTSVYGATKLNDGIASTSTTLAATANSAYTASRNCLHTLATTTKFYITGCTSASTNTAGDDFDTGVYATTTAGELSTVRHSWNVSGTEKVYTTWNNTNSSLEFIFV